MSHPVICPRTRRMLRVLGVAVFAIIVCDISSPGNAWSENSIKLESKWVEPGATNVELGVYLTNEARLSSFLVVFEIRSIHVGSFIRRSLDIRPQGRVVEWVGDFAYPVELYIPYRAYPRTDTPNHCPLDAEGKVWRWMRNDSLPDFMGEEAMLYFLTSESERCLEPGTDGEPSHGTPSVALVFDVTEEGGAFVIDSTCIAPANHIAFIDDDIVEIHPYFEPAIVLIGCNEECHGDPNCDGACNLIDLIKTIDVAFLNAPPVIDPDPRCPIEDTDVNCDRITSILDIVHMINVQYRFASESTEFCLACNHIPRTDNPKEDVRTPYFIDRGL